MSKIATVLLALGLLTSPALADSKITEAAKTTVRIGTFCSGTIVKSDRDAKSGEVETLILTAKHCIDDAKRVNVETTNYDKNRPISTVSYDAKVLGTSYKSDLGLIRLDDKKTLFENVAKVAKADVDLQWGDEVISVAFPMGLSKTLTKGNLGFVERMPIGNLSDSQEYYRATPQAVGGSSGGALFKANAAGDYELIGTVTGGFPQANFMVYYTPVEEINTYLEVALKKTP